MDSNSTEKLKRGGEASILILRGKGLGDVGKNACKAAIRADGHTLEALLSW